MTTGSGLLKAQGSDTLEASSGCLWRMIEWHDASSPLSIAERFSVTSLGLPLSAGMAADTTTVEPLGNDACAVADVPLQYLCQLRSEDVCGL
jgi:hypothetical protein